MFFEDWKNKEKMEIFIRVLLCKQKLFGNCFYVGGGAEDNYCTYENFKR